MPRLQEFEIEAAEDIVRSTEFPRIWAEWEVWAQHAAALRNTNYIKDSKREAEFYQKMEREMRKMRPLFRQRCPSIKWMRQFVEQFVRQIPEQTKTYRRRPLFIQDP
jgi:hypothetical protein